MTPTAKRPLPPELFDALASRTEGQELVQLWDLLEIAVPVAQAPSANKVWAEVEAAIAGDTELLAASAPLTIVDRSAERTVHPAAAGAAGTARQRANRRWHPAAPWAVAATLAVAAGLGVWQSQPVVVSAPAGEQLVVTLPDGSTAELNAGSELRYARGFRRMAGLLGGYRAVSLDGEAFFNVQRGEQPFTVRTGNAAVTVLGTRFMVRNHTLDSLGTQVAVVEGRVQVHAALRGQLTASAVTLGAGQGTVVRANAAAPDAAQAVVVERLTAWRMGALSFVDQPLEAIFREVERRYGVAITVRDVVFGDERLNIYYSERPTIEKVLSDLCTTGGLQFRRTSRGFEISPPAGSPPITP